MITNLFSIFDPCSSNFLSSNWYSIFLCFFILPRIYWTINSWYSLVWNILIEFIKKEFLTIIGKRLFRILLIVSLFIIILINNIYGLVPFIFTSTSHLRFTLSLRLPLWLGLIIYGYIFNITNLLIHLIPQSTPLILISFIVLIETVSNIIRPWTLAIRLGANITAGHLLISLLRITRINTNIIRYIPLLVRQLLLNLLEIIITFIQAYVFRILFSLYLNEVL